MKHSCNIDAATHRVMRNAFFSPYSISQHQHLFPAVAASIAQRAIMAA